MEKDRTVYVRIHLEAPNGAVGDVNLRYPKRHPRYRDVVAYLALGPRQARTITNFNLPRWARNVPPSPAGAIDE